MKTLMTALTLLAALTLIGCDAPPIAGQAETEPYPKISLNDGELADALRFDPTIVTTTDVGNLMLTQPIRSNSKEVLYVEWRVDWFDGAGRIVRPEMSWKRIRIEPRMQRRITTMATSPDAVDYQLYFRWSRP